MRKYYRALFSRELDNVYFANIFLALHASLLLYINSPFLTRIVSAQTLAVFYIAGSLVNIATMVYAPRMIAHYGVRTFALSVIILEAIGVVGLVTSSHPASLGLFFIVHQAMILLIAYILDLFLERAIRSELYTGRIRSIFLTISNVILVISPLIVSALVARTGSFVPIYLFAAALLVPLFFIVYFDLPKSGIGDKHVHLLQGLRSVWETQPLRGVTLCRLTLEFFYGWMVIYMALYLHNSIGFSWSDIGLLFSIMLVPFVLFELPLGNISDAHASEKEIIIIGFGIIAVSTALITTLTTPLFLQWAVILFSTRVGASFVEIGTESYFFKHVNARDTSVVSVFRLMRPLGFILAPLVITGLLAYTHFKAALFVCAFVSLIGLIPTLLLTEHKIVRNS